MNILLSLVEIYLPASLKMKSLKELFSLTANAFHSQCPSLQGYSYPELLDKYAAFTEIEAKYRLKSGDQLQGIQESLYQQAERMGKNLQITFRTSNFHDTLRLCRVVYRGIGIDFQGNDRGEIRILRCFFGKYYSKEVCEVMSSLDRGLVAGISGGGQLNFEYRITEGRDCCLAHLSPQEKNS